MNKNEKAILAVRDGGQPPPSPRLRKAGVNVQIFLIGLIILFGSAAFAQSSGSPAIPMLHAGYVLDETNTLNPTELAALDAKLRHYEDSTSTQICIVLIPSLNGNPVEDFAVTVLDSNHIGQKNKNNGALILLALTDHQGWISTGYGLEPTLTDAASSMIYQQILVPALRKGDVYGGLDQATTAMFQVIGGEFKNENPQSPIRGRRGSAPSPAGAFLIVLAFFFFLFYHACIGRDRFPAHGCRCGRSRFRMHGSGSCRDCFGPRSLTQARWRMGWWFRQRRRIWRRRLRRRWFFRRRRHGRRWRRWRGVVI